MPEPQTPPTSLHDQIQAATAGCGLAERSARGRLEMTGADRQRFLNAYVTCDVKALAPGDGAYGFFTTAQGRILSDAVVLAQADRLWLDVGPSQEGAIADHLRKFVIVDRVEIRQLQEIEILTLVGPRAAEALAAAVPEETWKHAQVLVDGVETTVQRRGLLGAPALSLWVPASDTPRVCELLLARDGVRPVGEEALEVLRAEAGIPRFGVDFGADNFPQETGLAEAVSYTKGCYLGQEVVARIHYRGGVQKELRKLRIQSGSMPRSGAPLLFDGREAGAATTVVQTPDGRTIGLGIVHRRAAEPGTRLEMADGGWALVD